MKEREGISPTRQIGLVGASALLAIVQSESPQGRRVEREPGSGAGSRQQALAAQADQGSSTRRRRARSRATERPRPGRAPRGPRGILNGATS